MKYCSQDQACLSPYGMIYVRNEVGWWRREYPILDTDHWEPIVGSPASGQCRLLEYHKLEDILRRYPLPTPENRTVE